MSTESILVPLTEVFRDIFDDDSLTLRRELTAGDVAGWDSMAHVRLILAVERRFKVRLPSTKVAGLKNVGELMDLINTCLKR